MVWALCLFLCSLTPQSIDEVRRLLVQPKPGANLEASEKSYQTSIRPQLVSELLDLYSEENQSRVKIAFASFTPRGPHRPMGDFGFGLHVVKRLEIGERVVDINEQWGEDPVSGGLFLPDEIRVKFRAREGERHVLGSENLYWFDSIRLAWDASNTEAHLFRRTRFTSYDGKNHQKRMRSPVSAPYSCTGCHHSPSTRAERFLQPGETRSHEALVQRAYFDINPSQMHGYRELVEHLTKKGVAPSFLNRVKDSLQKEKFHSLALRKAMREALKRHLVDEITWLPEDFEVDSSFESRPGFWRKQDVPMLDAIERALPGKYESWFPTPAIP